jgi:crotonobetainyl-CoA:carnitine CoA-transferase CaiB-like acyl-CoA transferase
MGPLAGKKIVEIAGLGPGPVCGMLLADMGAEVTVIDRPATSNPSALALANAAIMNRGKKSIALDLKMEGGRDVVLRLLENANGLIEGFRPGVMERLGLGPGDCLEVNPRLVYGRMTGWGQAGPLSQVAGQRCCWPSACWRP